MTKVCAVIAGVEYKSDTLLEVFSSLENAETFLNDPDSITKKYDYTEIVFCVIDEKTPSLKKETPVVGINIGNGRKITITTEGNLALQDSNQQELIVLGKFTQHQADTLALFIRDLKIHLPAE